MDDKIRHEPRVEPSLALANERTFLAWVRTALALIALGVGVVTFVSTQLAPALATALALGLITVGGVVAALSWFRWLSVDRALRSARGLPAPALGPWLAFGVSVLAVIAIVAIVLRL